MGSAVACYGVQIGLRATEDEGLALLKDWLPQAAKRSRALVAHRLYSFVRGGPGPRAGVKRFHVLYRDARRIARSFDLEEVRRAFNRDLSMTIGETAKRRVFVHAGVVGFDGGAVVVPGRSFSGKTTLIRALVDQGGVYYSDEYAVLDSRGRVFPWAEPLSIRRHGTLRPGEAHSAGSLGMLQGRKALPVSLVVLTTFESGRRFRPKGVTAAMGTLGLLDTRCPRAAGRGRPCGRSPPRC